MKKTFWVAILAVLLSTITLAGPLNMEHVPATAHWLFHIDLNMFRTTEMGGLIQNEIREKHQTQIEALTKLIGMDITQDIHGITLYGKDIGEENAVFMCYGKFDSEKLTAIIALNADYKKQNYKRHTLHFWEDEKKNKDQVGTFAQDNLIIISQKKSQVTDALDLLAGEETPLSYTADLPLYALCSKAEDPIVLAAVDGISNIAEDKEHAIVLRNSKLAAFIASEQAGNLKLSIHLETETVDAAVQIEQMMRGIMALGIMKSQENEDLKKLIDQIQLSRSDQYIDVSIRYPSAELFSMMKKHAPNPENLDLDNLFEDKDDD